jgi:hypothetical protein
VTHVYPKDVSSARNQLPDRFGFFRSWAERADDFCLPHLLKPQVCPKECKAKKRRGTP